MPSEYIQGLLIQKARQAAAVGLLENQLRSLLFCWTDVFWRMPILSYFIKMQLIKMRLTSDTESKVPNASAALEERCSSMRRASRFLAVLASVAFDTLI